MYDTEDQGMEQALKQQAQIREQESVNVLRNLMVLLIACTHMTVDPQLVIDTLPERIRKVIVAYSPVDLIKENWKKLSEEVFQGAMLKLSEYNQQLFVVSDHLGHPAKLIEVGRYANDVSFGSEAVQKQVAGSWLGRFTMSPHLLYGNLSKGALQWVLNKVWKVTHTGRSSVMLWCKYQLETNILDDIYSLYYLIFGMNQKFPQLVLFSRESNPLARVTFRRFAAPIDQALERFFQYDNRMWIARSDFRWDGNKYYWRGKHLATRVWLVKDDKGQYGGNEWSYDEIEDAPIGMLVENDLLSESIIDRSQQHVLIREGTIFQVPSGETETMTDPKELSRRRWKLSTLHVEWDWCVADFLFRLFGSKSIGKQFVADLDTEVQQHERLRKETAAALSALGLRKLIELMQNALQENFPNLQTAMQVIRTGFLTSVKRAIQVNGFIITIDIVGSGDLMAQYSSDREWVLRKQEFIDELTALCRRHGMWVYQFLGDGFMIYAGNGFGKIGSVDTTRMSHGEIFLREVIPGLVAVQRLAKERLGADLRIGVSYGLMWWVAHKWRHRIDSGGPTIRTSARIEPKVPMGQIGCSAGMADLLEAIGLNPDDYLGKTVKITMKKDKIDVRLVVEDHLAHPDEVPRDPWPEHMVNPAKPPELIVR